MLIFYNKYFYDYFFISDVTISLWNILEFEIKNYPYAIFLLQIERETYGSTIKKLVNNN